MASSHHDGTAKMEPKTLGNRDLKIRTGRATWGQQRTRSYQGHIALEIGRAHV